MSSAIQENELYDFKLISSTSESPETISEIVFENVAQFSNLISKSFLGLGIKYRNLSY